MPFTLAKLRMGITQPETGHCAQESVFVYKCMWSGGGGEGGRMCGGRTDTSGGGGVDRPEF